MKPDRKKQIIQINQSINKRRKIMNTKIKYLFLFVLLISILAACGAPAPSVADPVTIAQGFWDAINAKNVDAAMAFVADDIVTTGFPEHYTNKADFRDFWLYSVDNGDINEITDLKLTSEGTVTYHIKVYLRGNTELVNTIGKLQVKDGKILYMELQ
jgi:ketosteroid isomerase-like protein